MPCALLHAAFVYPRFQTVVPILYVDELISARSTNPSADIWFAFQDQARRQEGAVGTHGQSQGHAGGVDLDNISVYI